MSATQETPGFWDWSLHIYDQDDVSRACLILQDRHGLDVNMVLWCVWAVRAGYGVIDDDTLAGGHAFATYWSAKITANLRSVRRNLRPAPAGTPIEWAEALRANTLEVELDAERVEQDFLQALLDGLQDPSDAADLSPRRARQVALNNLVAYADMAGADGVELERNGAFDPLLAAAFPG